MQWATLFILQFFFNIFHHIPKIVKKCLGQKVVIKVKVSTRKIYINLITHLCSERYGVKVTTQIKVVIQGKETLQKNRNKSYFTGYRSSLLNVISLDSKDFQCDEPPPSTRLNRTLAHMHSTCDRESL